MSHLLQPRHYKKSLHLQRPTALLLALGIALPAVAQIAPDAGQTLQQTLPPVLQVPRPAPGVDVQVPVPNPTPPGGVTVMLESLHIAGNTVFTQAQLQAVVGDVAGKTFDMGGLRSLANGISAYYRANGYPFARAFLPTQPLTDGALRIEVVEGQYGKIIATGDDAGLAKRAEPFLARLEPGAVIESSQLERATLILDDLPGIKTAPIIRPGQQVGTGDLAVQVQRTKLVAGELGLDNHGSRYTGQNRARLNLDINSPFTLGDQFAIRTLVSDAQLWSGNVTYSTPLGASGLRGQVGYAQTYYELGQEFASLKGSGTAKVATLGVSYPLVRSQPSNVSLSATVQDKALSDAQGAVGTSASKSSQNLPLTLNFDRRDGVGGGAITYGALSYTAGELRLDSALAAADSGTAKTAGAFHKVNLDVARIQSLGPVWSLFGRVSAQWADKNLDSSEKMGLGGVNGVRAYPNGEGFGDEGSLVQLELRHTAGPYTSYVFYDHGEVTLNKTPWAAGANQRTVSGGGLGSRYQRGPWSLDAALAWRNQGGKPQSIPSANNPTGWLSLSYKF